MMPSSWTTASTRFFNFSFSEYTHFNKFTLCGNCDVSETEEAMGGILLLLLGLSTVDGLSLYEVKEGENVILWDITTRADLSSVHIACLFGPPVEPFRRVFDMVAGVEMTEQQDSQFSGRVLCDQEGLTRGHVRILLTGLGPQDSGDYECEMVTASDLESVHFVINVTSASGSAFGNPAGHPHEDSNKQTDTPNDHFYSQNTLKIAIPLVVVVIAVMMAGIVRKLCCERKQRGAIYVSGENTTQCLSELEACGACPSMGVDPSFSVVLPEVSPFAHGGF